MPDPAGAAAGVPALVAAAFRADQGRTIASLLRSFGDLDLAEESVQDAYAQALRTWGCDGAPVPDRPGAWITTVARNRAIDRLRRAGRLEEKTTEMAVALDRRQADADTFALTETVADDRLRLLFTCCHPALRERDQVALTLRLVVGMTTEQIASVFLVAVPTMAARLTRAKARVRESTTPLRVPEDHELGDRVAAVLRVVHLACTQGHVAAASRQLQDVDLVREATRLARLLVRLLPDEPEAQGLLALVLLVGARQRARERGGRLVLLADQDRSLWDVEAITEGCRLVETALRRGRPGPYQVQAAIQAVHCEAVSAAATDWSQIAALYEVLTVVDPSPVVRMNHAVAVHRVEGPAAGLAVLEGVREQLDGHHLLHAARATMLAELGEPDAAAVAWRAALARTTNEVERRFVRDRLAALGHDA